MMVSTAVSASIHRSSVMAPSVRSDASTGHQRKRQVIEAARPRSVLCIGSTEPITARAGGDDDLRALRVPLQLGPEPLHERTEIVAFIAIRRSPYLAQQRAVIDHLARAACERGQQTVLGRREPDFGAVAKDQALREIDGDTPAPRDDVRARRRMNPPKHRPNSRKQLVGAERLGQVVVGSHVKSPDLVLLAATRADHDHRRRSTSFQVLENLPAVDERQPYVEQDDVERRSRFKLSRAGGAVARGVRLVALAFEDRADRVAQGRIVFDDQNPAHWAGVWGIVNRKIAPGSAPSSTAMVPACASTRPLTMARPRPVLPTLPSLSPRKNRSKMRSRISGGIPGPRSLTRIVTSPGSSRETRSMMGVPAGANRSAFDSRLSKIWPSLSQSARTSTCAE